MLVVRHPIRAPAHVWIPHLTPTPENVAGDAVFRAPAVVLADAGLALALVVDVDDVAHASGWRAWLDYDHATRTITLAAGAYRAGGHVFYERVPARLGDARVRLRLHVLSSTDPKDLANPYGLAARWLWERWGRPGLAAMAGPPIDALARHVLRWAFASGWTESVWQEVDGLRRTSAPARPSSSSTSRAIRASRSPNGRGASREASGTRPGSRPSAAPTGSSATPGIRTTVTSKSAPAR